MLAWWHTTVYLVWPWHNMTYSEWKCMTHVTYISYMTPPYMAWYWGTGGSCQGITHRIARVQCRQYTSATPVCEADIDHHAPSRQVTYISRRCTVVEASELINESPTRLTTQNIMNYCTIQSTKYTPTQCTRSTTIESIHHTINKYTAYITIWCTTHPTTWMHSATTMVLHSAHHKIRHRGDHVIKSDKIKSNFTFGTLFYVAKVLDSVLCNYCK